MKDPISLHIEGLHATLAEKNELIALANMEFGAGRYEIKVITAWDQDHKIILHRLDAVEI